MIDAAFTRAQHDKALDLASDRLDFDLDAGEERWLNAHLGACDDCRRFAEMMRGDDGLIERFEWLDDYDGGERDEFSPFGGGPGRPDPTSKDRRDARDDASRDDDAPRDAGDDSDDPRAYPDDAGDRDAAGSPSDDEDDDEEDVSTVEGDLDAVAADDEDVEPEVEPDDDEDVSPVDDEEEGRRGSAPGLPDETPDEAESESRLNSEHDGEEAEAAINAAAAMSDEELADVESDPRDADGDFPSEISDGVEDVAERHGVKSTKYLHERAETLVRQDDGVERTQYGRVAVYRSARGIRKSVDKWSHAAERPEVSGKAASAIRNAILRSRVGTTGVERFQKRGKLDGKSLHRVASHDPRLFKRNVAPDPGKFLVWVMVDVSASMSGQPIVDAATVARSLAEATSGTPTVRLEVWAWSDPFLRTKTLHSNCVAGVVRVWGRGMPTTEMARLTTLPMGGTPDAPVLEWAWREILKNARSDETPVIMMCSDGWGDSSLPQVIERARKHGVDVRSVALGNYVHEIDQEKRFGAGNYVPWQGSIEMTARPLAEMVARMAQGKR